MPNNKLYIDQLRDFFGTKEKVQTNDISDFYLQLEPGLNSSAINWRIYSLVKSGVLNRIGRGLFSFEHNKIFIPEISSKIRLINSKLNKAFPYLKKCIWNTSSLNEFMVHQPGRFYIIIEVDKIAVDPVFYFLKENKYPVFIEPSLDLIVKYVQVEKEALIVKPLVSEAPVQIVNKISTTTIEKMLVDIFCDEVLFVAYQGNEMKTIFTEAFTKYAVNETRMLRYADRRRKKESLFKYLKTITNKRQ